MSLAERLRRERRILGLSQAQLAFLGGVQPNAQCNYENGSRCPRADYLMSLANVGMDVQFILMGVRSFPGPAQLSSAESTIIRSLRSLKEDDRRAFEQILMRMASEP
ncbi:helix-turn-helix domain-containing protein [Pseudomonas alliivorans]|uniref:helix-turn-helix domain-containing protein n=1 Tax=Pseudomonas alliivorans TaxID=2810613 RepID=UPI00338D4904